MDASLLKLLFTFKGERKKSNIILQENCIKYYDGNTAIIVDGIDNVITKYRIETNPKIAGVLKFEYNGLYLYSNKLVGTDKIKLDITEVGDSYIPFNYENDGELQLSITEKELYKSIVYNNLKYKKENKSEYEAIVVGIDKDKQRFVYSTDQTQISITKIATEKDLGNEFAFHKDTAKKLLKLLNKNSDSNIDIYTNSYLIIFKAKNYTILCDKVRTYFPYESVYSIIHSNDLYANVIEFKNVKNIINILSQINTDKETINIEFYNNTMIIDTENDRRTIECKTEHNIKFRFLKDTLINILKLANCDNLLFYFRNNYSLCTIVGNYSINYLVPCRQE